MSQSQKLIMTVVVNRFPSGVFGQEIEELFHKATTWWKNRGESLKKITPHKSPAMALHSQNFILSLTIMSLAMLCPLIHSAACGPPMCNNNLSDLKQAFSSSLLAPALVIWIHNHAQGNSTLKNLPCTACLPCCNVLLQLERVSTQHREVMSHIVSMVDHVDWTCSAQECPLHDHLRRSLSKVIEEKSASVLEVLEFMSQQATQGESAIIASRIKQHLLEYASEVIRNGNSKPKQHNMKDFISNVMSCPCTACPLECSFR